MTSKLKCPFCQTELDYDEYGWDYSCSNPSCQKSLGILSGTEKLWHALIQAKQDLEFFKEEQGRAVDALIERTKELDRCQKDLKESQQATLENAQTILEIHEDLEIARKALEEIKKVCDGCRWCDSNLYDPTPSDGRRIAETTNKALEQIEHKE